MYPVVTRRACNFFPNSDFCLYTPIVFPAGVFTFVSPRASDSTSKPLPSQEQSRLIARRQGNTGIQAGQGRHHCFDRFVLAVKTLDDLLCRLVSASSRVVESKAGGREKKSCAEAISELNTTQAGGKSTLFASSTG